MKQLLSYLIILGALTLSDVSEAQQAQGFGDYVVHYNFTVKVQPEAEADPLIVKFR